MVCTKRIKLSIVASLMMISSCFAISYSANAINQDQKDAIIQNCGNIKQSLIKLQHSDSRTRTYLGSAYEAVAGRFITPLNLRLVKNGLPSTELFKIQNDFTAAQTTFRDKYVEYMRELEGLIATDCAAHPEDFYQKLETTRQRRGELRQTAKKLSDLVDKQYQTVEELKVMPYGD